MSYREGVVKCGIQSDGRYHFFRADETGFSRLLDGHVLSVVPRLHEQCMKFIVKAYGMQQMNRMSLRVVDHSCSVSDRMKASTMVGSLWGRNILGPSELLYGLVDKGRFRLLQEPTYFTTSSGKRWGEVRASMQWKEVDW